MQAPAQKQPPTTYPHSTLRLPSSRHLTTKLLDSAEIGLPGREGQGHDTANVHLGAVHVHVELQLVADGFDVLETFLIVGAGATDPDLDVVFDEDRGDFSDGADDALESGGDLLCELVMSRAWIVIGIAYVGEVGNTTTDKENFAFRVDRGAEHQV